MRFADSETQKLLRDTARGYLRDRYPWERLYALESGGVEFSSSDLKDFAQLGWLGLLAPAADGGVSLLEAAVVVDECGYAAVPTPVAVSNIAAHLLASAGDEGAHVKELTVGARLYTVSEGTRGSDATRSGALEARDGTLNGVLPLVPFGAYADFVAAPLTIDGAAAVALVPLANARREEVRLVDRRGYCNLHFEGGAAEVLPLATGADAQSLHDLLDALTTAFGLVELAGMMQRVSEMTAEYIANRVQFGQPIAKFQAARHHAADLLMYAETARWTSYHALWALQRDPADTREVWLAKQWAIRAAQRSFEITHLLHGGIGVGLEYPLHLYTQGMAAFAVRNGTMNEMVARTLASLDLPAVAER